MKLPTTQKEAMDLDGRTFMKEVLPQLMRQLTADAPARWGETPSSQHIVEHLSSLLYLSRKENNLPLMIPKDKVEKAQSFLWKEGKMFRKGTKAPLIGAVPTKLKFETFEKALDVVEENLAEFYAYYEEEGREAMHPAFGMLDLKNWERFHHMHFVHHLGQFGVLEADMSPDPPVK